MIVYVCKHVLNDERPVHLVVHHNDDMWQLTCGKHDHSPDEPEIYPVHAEHIVERQAELANIMLDLKKGQLADFEETGWKKWEHDD